MKGLELARAYYAASKEQLLTPYGAYRQRIACGLVGPGSECLGFDDEYSRDHDFGPGFCLWLSDQDFATIGQALQADYDKLPQEYAGFSARSSNARSGKRVGVFSISGFYSQFLGAPQLPVSDADWLQIPEPLLATAVNGEVFEDPLGIFTEIRSALQSYYPDSVKRLKLATAAAKMAQSGQYNLPRAVRRGDMTAALLAQAEFITYACQFVYALNNRYAPFYKWLHRGMRDLPRLGRLHAKIGLLAQTPCVAVQNMIEDICADVLIELITQGYTTPGDAFLEAHVDAILAHKQDVTP
ncbi:DUF4037 domain-containing protein [Uliginosibacterium gangwonense]|uniref:DUF4037 domain-containing protein n=1 Tax=Uliginosibacterium gangwonense TaxID=392736 RepID=UPI00037DADEC|nr:DUF4037 domain-containing protein [Uliginosibacterium gangwonense]